MAFCGMRRRRRRISDFLVIKDYSILGVHYRDFQARAHEQETRNLRLHEAHSSAMLNFEFLVRERVLVNPDNARTKSAQHVLIFNSSKRCENMCILRNICLERFNIENVYHANENKTS